ncbi:unnamed protein product [Chrysoparadoxa australica]
MALNKLPRRATSGDPRSAGVNHLLDLLQGVPGGDSIRTTLDEREKSGGQGLKDSVGGLKSEAEQGLLQILQGGYEPKMRPPQSPGAGQEPAAGIGLPAWAPTGVGYSPVVKPKGPTATVLPSPQVQQVEAFSPITDLSAAAALLSLEEIPPLHLNGTGTTTTASITGTGCVDMVTAEQNGKVRFLFCKMDPALRSQLRFDTTSLFSITNQRTADDITQLVLALPGVDRSRQLLVDGTACVGGNTISFASAAGGAFSQVWAIELDAKRYDMLRHNVSVALGAAGKGRVTCTHGDFLSLLQMQRQKFMGSIVFLDPPWGGPKYKEALDVELSLSDCPLSQVCEKLKGLCRYIVLKVPVNFGIERFSGQVSGEVSVCEKLHKMLLLVVDYGEPARAVANTGGKGSAQG